MSFLNETNDNNFFISSWKHIHPIPEFLKNISVEEFELILRLASESLISLRDSTNSLKFEDVLNKKTTQFEEQKTKEIEKIQKGYNEEVAKKQKQIERLEVANKEIQESYNLLQQNFLNLQNSVTQSIEKTFSCTMEKQNIFFSGQVSSIQKASESRESMYKDTINELKQKLEKYEKQSLIEQNSSMKGKQGEASFESLVSQFTSWSLEDTSKIPDACDRQAIIDGCKTLFEIKNYTTKVPKAEVDKFKRNMEQHKDAPLGVFISLKTNIIGAPQENLYTEINSNNQIFVYIQNFLMCDAETIFSVINNYVSIALKFYTKTNELCDTVDIQLKIDSIKPILNSSFKEISDMMNELNKNKKFMIDSVTKQHSTMKLHIDKMKMMFESIFKLLFEEEKTMIVEDVVEPVVNKAVKRKKKSSTPVVDNE